MGRPRNRKPRRPRAKVLREVGRRLPPGAGGRLVRIFQDLEDDLFEGERPAAAIAQVLRRRRRDLEDERAGLQVPEIPAEFSDLEDVTAKGAYQVEATRAARAATAAGLLEGERAAWLEGRMRETRPAREEAAGLEESIAFLEDLRARGAQTIATGGAFRPIDEEIRRLEGLRDAAVTAAAIGDPPEDLEARWRVLEQTAAEHRRLVGRLRRYRVYAEARDDELAKIRPLDDDVAFLGEVLGALTEGERET